MTKLTVAEHSFHNFLAHFCHEHQGRRPDDARRKLQTDGALVVSGTSNDAVFTAQRFMARLEAAYHSLSPASADRVAHGIIGNNLQKPVIVSHLQTAMAYLDATRPKSKSPKFLETVEMVP